jgi:transcriptional regulator with XRE-family HTH domain
MVLPIFSPRYVAIRQQLKLMRKAAKLTQIELAVRLGEDQSYVSKIERGERYVDVLFFVDWCLACGHQPDEALKWHMEHTPPFPNPALIAFPKGKADDSSLTHPPAHGATAGLFTTSTV